MGLDNLLLIPGLGQPASSEPSANFSLEDNSMYVAILIEEF